MAICSALGDVISNYVAPANYNFVVGKHVFDHNCVYSLYDVPDDYGELMTVLTVRQTVITDCVTACITAIPSMQHAIQHCITVILTAETLIRKIYAYSADCRTAWP